MTKNTEKTNEKKKEKQQKTSVGGEHSGHRQRLMNKLDDDSLCPHELLEMLLFFAIPRQNTNPLAHRLLAEFGSLYNVLSASVEQLTSVKGIGGNTAAFLSCVGKLTQIVGEQEQATFPPVFDTGTFYPFVKRTYQNLPYEVLDAFFLDPAGYIFRKRRFSTAQANNVQLKIEELNEALIKDSPSGVVLVHNHPSGNASPSEMDDVTTRKMQAVCSMQNVLFCDHIICGKSGLFSYYASGRIQEISKNCAFETLVQTNPLQRLGITTED